MQGTFQALFRIKAVRITLCEGSASFAHIEEGWTKTSPPSSLEINPKPLDSWNHITALLPRSGKRQARSQK